MIAHPNPNLDLRARCYSLGLTLLEALMFLGFLRLCLYQLGRLLRLWLWHLDSIWLRTFAFAETTGQFCLDVFTGSLR